MIEVSFFEVPMIRSRQLVLVFAILAGMSAVACGGGGGRTGSPAIPAPEDVAAPPPGSLKTTTGLSTKVLQPGTGTRHPRPTDRVTVHYTGWSTNGQSFDSSVARGTPSTFALNEVIPGWTEGLQLMVEGEKRRFWIPAQLAYEGQPSRPQGMLVFDIELIKIE